MNDATNKHHIGLTIHSSFRKYTVIFKHIGDIDANKIFTRGKAWEQILTNIKSNTENTFSGCNGK